MSFTSQRRKSRREQKRNKKQKKYERVLGCDNIKAENQPELQEKGPEEIELLPFEKRESKSKEKKETDECGFFNCGGFFERWAEIMNDQNSNCLKKIWQCCYLIISDFHTLQIFLAVALIWLGLTNFCDQVTSI